MTTPTDRRRAATAASEGQTAARNSSNIAANTASNAGASALLAGLPGPLSGAATALSEGIASAIKNSGSQAKPVPPTSSSLADPSKLFAAQLAFAIITAIWCFIKSILHPLPIIGMFFPLCSDEDRARDSAAVTAPPIGGPTTQSSGQGAVLPQEPQADIGSAGLSFEQFLSRQATIIDPFAVIPRQLPTTQNNSQQQSINNVSPQTPTTGIVQAGSVITDSNNSRDAADIRKLFGL